MLDDHALIRMGFAQQLSRAPDLEMAALYATSREVLDQLASAAVDVLVLDYTLQHNEMDGLNLIGLLRRRFPEVRILVSSASELPATVSLCLRAGARGFVGKSQAPEKMLEAIRAVATERIYIDPEIAQQLASLPGQTLEASPLSPREQEVVRCCLAGMTVSQIAEKFTRSVKTISAQKQAAFRKLGLRGNSELFKIYGDRQ